ncbi:MAG: cytochrome c-type biogenesis CcmF C-terminal domain-containing protein [Acidimicrobiia bacterium]|nr:cytochrome c-type biogenesis CcmF C-terminal domain-containing protein [Acidimicrobiia bacterium]
MLLGTVFPLLVEALNGERISVGTPYFNRMTMPVGFALLFLMAVAPALPWRKASGELLRERLLWPAWAGTGCVVFAVVVGARGLGRRARLRPRRFARRCRRPAARARRPPAGLARVRRSGERRHGRPSRRRDPRRRVRGLVELREPGRLHPATG